METQVEGCIQNPYGGGGLNADEVERQSERNTLCC